MNLPGVVRAGPVNAVAVARGVFALASASIAVWILVFGQWVPQPLPAATPLRELLTYAVVVVILVASAGLCVARIGEHRRLDPGVRAVGTAAPAGRDATA